MADRGITDPFEGHRKRPLAEHLADWAASLLADGATAKHVKQTLACARRVIAACGFTFMADLSASRVQQYLAGLREQRLRLPPFDREQADFTKKELAALLDVKPSAVTALMRHHRLVATGNGKARRYPRATAEALRSLRSRGRSIKTSNLYLDAMKGFAGWLVQDRAPPTTHWPTCPEGTSGWTAGTTVGRSRWTTCAPSSTRPPEVRLPSGSCRVLTVTSST